MSIPFLPITSTEPRYPAFSEMVSLRTRSPAGRGSRRIMTRLLFSSYIRARSFFGILVEGTISPKWFFSNGSRAPMRWSAGSASLKSPRLSASSYIQWLKHGLCVKCTWSVHPCPPQSSTSYVPKPIWRFESDMAMFKYSSSDV